MMLNHHSLCVKISAQFHTVEALLNETLTLSSSFIQAVQHSSSPFPYVKWSVVYWQLGTTSRASRRTQTTAEDLCLLISSSSVGSSLSGHWNAKVSLSHSRQAHCSSWHLSHHCAPPAPGKDGLHISPVSGSALDCMSIYFCVCVERKRFVLSEVDV